MHRFIHLKSWQQAEKTMNKLKTGEFYGTHYQKVALENLIITDTEYTHRKVDWHYHESPYFTYLLQGKLFESNKKDSCYLESGNYQPTQDWKKTIR